MSGGTPAVVSSHTHRRPRIVGALLFLFLALVGAPGRARAQDAPPDPAAAQRLDPEGCLLCHRFPGLSRLDAESGELRLFFTSEAYVTEEQGSHAKLRCTDCHAREEVEVIPHQDVTPVSCEQTCHLIGGSGSLTLFSHEGVAASVEKSVHKAETLQEIPFDKELLRPGQSTCLNCHDQPSFRDAELVSRTHRGAERDTRCYTCHNSELAIDTRYYMRHTSSRQQAARPPLETAQSCAICHSDPTVNEEYSLHDAVTSYFRSFHGKAALLGDTSTATCVDCHRTEAGDGHLIRSSEDSESRTNLANMDTTCRSTYCHPNAVPELSAAAVHPRIDPRTWTAEYIVMGAFVLLILFELTMYYVLVILENLKVAFGRKSQEELKVEAIAEALSETKDGRKGLQRMTVNQRIQHWLLVVFFGLLVATGMPMKFATRPGMSQIADLFGGIAGARIIHRVSAVLLFVLLGYHVIYASIKVFRAVRARRQADPELSLFRAGYLVFRGIDIIPTWTDIKHFVQLFAYLLKLREHHPRRPKYHLSQKLEYWAVFWGMVVIGISGIMLWAESSTPEFFGGRALNFAYIVHSYEAFLAMMYIVIAHLFAVLLAPPVFPLSMGAITGQVPPAENAEQHSGFVMDLAKKFHVDAEPEPPPKGPKAFLRSAVVRVYALMLVAVVGVLAFYSWRLMVRDLRGDATAIDVATLPTRLDAAVLAPENGEAANGVQRGEARNLPFLRGPASHFHIIPAWFTPTGENSCTTAGCHEALPHGAERNDRAFLNMHTTFLDCQVCHAKNPDDMDQVEWISPQTRQTAQPPAVLRLAAALDPALYPGPDGAQEEREVVMGLLGQAISESGGNVELERWLLQLQTSRIGGIAYEETLTEMRAGIRRHGHGEYGVKIGIPGRDPMADPEQQARQARLRADDEAEDVAKLDEDARQALVDELHSDVERPDVSCVRCHEAEGGFIDYLRLGYSPPRAEALRSNDLGGYARKVEAGDEFYLPQVLSARSGPLDDDEPDGAGAPPDMQEDEPE